MYILHVIPLKKGIPFDTVSYYWAEALKPGTLVKITINNRPLFGIVEHSEGVLEAKSSIRSASFRLKKLTGVVGGAPALEHIIEAIKLVRIKTLAPLGSIFSSVVSSDIGELKLNLLVDSNSTNDEMEQKEPHFFVTDTKTRFEEYKILMRTTMAKGFSAVFVVPTIYDAKVLHEWLAKGIAHKVYLAHQSLSTLALKTLFSALSESDRPCALVMTVPYLPLIPSSCGVLVIEKSSSSFYRTNDRFGIDTRLVIEAFTTCAGITLYYGDCLPSFEQLERAQSITAVRISPLHHITLVSPENSKKEIIFPKTIDALIESAISSKKNVWIFAHRKGIAPVSRCKDCGTVVSCIECGFPLLLRRAKESQSQYVCTHCGRNESASTPCRTCKSWNIFAQRIGVEAVVEHCAKQFPDARIVLHEDITKTNTRKKKESAHEGPMLYIGTEALLPYIEHLSYAIIPFFDRMYATPSYETSERLMRAMILAHEYATKGVYIVTAHTDIDSIKTLERGTVRTYIADELSIRKQLNFPPWGVLLRLTVTARASEWPHTGTIVDAILTKMELSYTTLPLVRTKHSSMQCEKSWIIQTDDVWLSENGPILVSLLEEGRIRYTIERNPYYFL